MANLQQATLEARKRTGDKSIATRVEAGRIQVVKVTYPAGGGGRSNVEPITEYMTIGEAIRALEAL